MNQDVLDLPYLRQLDFVVSNYSELGGLRLAPIGLFSLFMAPFAGGLVELPVEWTILLGVLALQVTVVGYWLIACWYRKNYGMTRQAWPSSNVELGSQLLVWAAVSLMVISAIYGLSVYIEVLGYMVGMSAMGWMLFYWKRRGEMWPQGYALMTLFAIGAILQHASPSVGEHGHFGLLLAFMGTMLLAACAVDHNKLARATIPLEEDEDE